jgi:3-oxoadipate enol-lactonase
MALLDVNGGRIDVVEAGTGKPLLLLHSLLADRAVFDPIVPALARTRRVILPHLPGFGGSSPAGATAADIADRVAGLFDVLDLASGDTDVLGNGFGGFVASALAIRHGHRFSRLVLADTGVVFTEQGKASFHAMAGRVREFGLEGIADIAIGRLFPDAFIAGNSIIVAERRAALLRMDSAIFAQICEALADLDLRAEIGKVRNPTLVLVGSLDTATPPAMARELAGMISQAEFIELEGLGHAPMVQDPGTFLEAISGFLGTETEPVEEPK